MTAFGSPRTLGRYSLVTELASSHLGPLWLVQEESGGLAMARRIRLGAHPDQGVVDRISEAAFTATEIDQALVSKVTEVLLQGSEIGVVQAYLEGATLRTIQRSATTRRRPIPPEVAIRLALDLLDALTALHGYQEEFGELSSLLFGGVNPDSLLVATTGRLYVLDPLVSGAASTVESIRSHSDRLAYTSPEQNEVDATIDARSDVFCAGTLLWELLAERRLFMGMGKSIAQKVRSLKIPRLDEIEFKERSALPTSVADVVARSLDRDPSQRFQSTEEMRAALAATGMAVAEPEQVAAYLEGVAEFELRKQRESCATPDTHQANSPDPRLAGIGRKLPAVVPRRELRSRPEADPERSPIPEAAPNPPKRAAKQTLLGLAPPKPRPDPEEARSREAPRAASGSVEATEPAREPAPRDSDEPPTLVADVASIARALEESQRKAEDKNPEASLAQDVTAVSTPLAVAAPIGLEIPAGSADDQAFDAELEAVYDNPVPVRMASIDPDPRRERDGSPGVPTGANVAVAAALADALAPVAEKQDPQPESTDLGELLAQTPDRTSPEEPGLTPPSEQSVTAEAQPEATAPQATVEATASSAAVTAVPLIHDARFGGPGPREARAKTSFLGGILVGAAVVFVLAIVLVVVVLLLLLRRGHEEAAAPASTPSAAPMVTSAAPATVVKPTSSARPPEPAIEPAKPETTEDPEKAEETEEKPSSTNEAPAPKAAPRPRPRPRPKPKPSFVPDEI